MARWARSAPVQLASKEVTSSAVFHAGMAGRDTVLHAPLPVPVMSTLDTASVPDSATAQRSMPLLGSTNIMLDESDVCRMACGYVPPGWLGTAAA